MSKFGWSYPPGAANDPNAPYNQAGDGAIDLAEDKCLKGYGRRGHGLNGKDADLDMHGQNVVTEAWWTEDDVIRIRGYRFAALVPGEEWTEEQLYCATEIIGGSGYSGEWDGDYWILREDYSLTVPCAWADDETDAQNVKRALAAAHEAIDKDSEAFLREIESINKAFANFSEE